MQTNEGNAPHMLAAVAGHSEVVEYLLAQGADPDTGNRHTNTALMLSAGRGHHETISALLAAGADTRIRNKKRERVRDITNRSTQPRVLLLLDRHENNRGWLDKLRQLMHINYSSIH